MKSQSKFLESWNWWCYHNTYMRNILTGNINQLSTGRYNSGTDGLSRIGTNKVMLNLSEEWVEETVLVVQPPRGRLPIADIPSSVSLNLFFSGVELNDDESNLIVKVSPWANIDGLGWVSETDSSFSDFKDHYIPFDLSPSTYNSSIYESTSSVSLFDYGATISELENAFYKFLQKETTGFLITASNGYANCYNPNFGSLGLRPKFNVNIVISGQSGALLNLDIEVRGRAKIKGVCRDRNGAIMTGSNCNIVAFDPNSHKIIGSALSDSDGSFLFEVNSKVGENIAVSFTEPIRGIFGAEIMKTLSLETV